MKLNTLPFPSDHFVVVLNCELSSGTVLSVEIYAIDWKYADLDKFPELLDDMMPEAPIWEDRTMDLPEIENAIYFSLV